VIERVPLDPDAVIRASSKVTMTSVGAPLNLAVSDLEPSPRAG
jgi:hypothetical protein